jgi:hypothetical protein
MARVRRGCDASNIQPCRYLIITCVYLKDLFDALCNLCLFAHDCLFDRKLIQSVVLLIALRQHDHPFCYLIEGWHPQKSSLARSQYP